MTDPIAPPPIEPPAPDIDPGGTPPEIDPGTPSEEPAILPPLDPGDERPYAGGEPPAVL